MRVVGREEVGVHEKWRDCRLERLAFGWAPERIAHLDVALCVFPPEVRHHQVRHLPLGVVGLEVQRGGGGLEILRELVRRDVATPLRRQVREIRVLPPLGIVRTEASRVKLRAMSR